ncbi:carbamoyl-phosphate synthase [Synechococcus sp. UW140]|uniref:carbamoyl-phosphate synthase n=1 Tax=Synechococcus sp. UW140 TaxID=368503 RepID=UPI003137D1D0
MNKIFTLSFSLLGSSSFALASIPFGIGSAKAQEAKTTEGTAADLGVMEVNLKDAVKFNWGFQGALQGAGTPNQAGVGAFFPLHIGNNSVTYADVLVNANFGDYNGLSSIGTTKVAGTTISTSTRLGYRWLNKNRSWMFGVNAGYDSRPMATGSTVNDDAITDSQTPFFQQIALNLEAKSDKFSVSAYGLVPVGNYGAGTGNIAVINNNYVADNLSTYGLDIGYNISPSIQLILGGYYQLDEKDQHYELNGAQSFGLKTGLNYDITNELQAGVIYSYDENFESRITGNLKWRFGGGSKTKKSESVIAVYPVIQALSATPENRDVRVANNPCAGVFDHTGGFSGPQLAYARNQQQLNSRVGGHQIAGNLAAATLNLIGMGSSIAAQNSQACADFRNSSPGTRGLRLVPSPNLTPQDAQDIRRLQQARAVSAAVAGQRALSARTHANFRRSFR